MYQADLSKLDLSGLRVYLYIVRRQVEYFTNIDPNPEQKAHYSGEVQRSTEAIAGLIAGSGGASGNSDDGEEGQEG